MAITIVTRAGKGSALTHNEADANFTNLADAIETVITPAASATPAAIGDLVIEATSDTLLTIKYKGSDGIVRAIGLPIE
jgi:hypothetical protein